MKTAELAKVLRPSGIIFDEAAHTYKNDKGELYTGCTTISEAWDKSFFLGPWYAKEMANLILTAPWDMVSKFTPSEFEKFILNAKSAAKLVSEKAKQDGTAAHDWIANRIASKIVPETALIPTPESEKAKNACTAFANWAKGKDIKWLASEEVVASHEYRTGGKLDAIAVIEGITYLVDFKTSGQISSSYLLQCAGYDIMLREMGLQVMGHLILRIPKDGTPAESLTVTNREDMKFYRETFLKQREAHKFYVYMESHFQDAQTHKMKVDEKPPATVQVQIEKLDDTFPARMKELAKHPPEDEEREAVEKIIAKPAIGAAKDLKAPEDKKNNPKQNNEKLTSNIRQSVSSGVGKGAGRVPAARAKGRTGHATAKRSA